MAENFNKLSPAETELLSCFAEECGEVIHMIGKVLRHGWESTHPDYDFLSNRDLLSREVGDLQAVTGLIYKHLNASVIDVYRESKYRKMKPYLHHN